MSSKLESLKSPVLNWIIVLFILIIIITAFISEFFQTPNNHMVKQDNFKQIVTSEQIQQVDSMLIQNSIGEFRLTKDKNKNWFISSPRKLPAKNSPINHLLSSLKKIKVKNVYPKDRINLTNFSLHQPRFQITLSSSTAKFNSDFVFKFGPHNPLNNSSYILFSDKPVIFQIENFELNLEATTFTEHIDSRLFPFDISRISKITINRYGKKSLQLRVLDKEWIGESKPLLNQNKVITFVTELTQIRSPIILDHVSEKQKKKIERYLKNPAVSISFTTNNTEHTYQVSTVINNIPELKSDLTYYFLVRKEGSKNIYISTKDSFSIFYKKERYLR